MTSTANDPRPGMPRLHWQSGLYAVATVVAAFLLPGIALCKIVPFASIATAIAWTTLGCALLLNAAGRAIESRSLRDLRADYCLQASIFVMFAGLVWLAMALQSGPWRTRSIDFASGLSITAYCGVYAAMVLRSRARRLRRRQEAPG